MKIIGLVGKKGSGKTTLANDIYSYCRKNSLCYKFSFSSILKSMILKAKICEEDELYFNKTTFSRGMLQKIGTNIIREQIDKDFFCKKMIKELMEISKINPTDKNIIIVIDDVRFQNEAELIGNIGGILIKVIRPDLNEEDIHESETEMDQIEDSVTIFNDSTLENLTLAAKGIAQFILAFKKTRFSNLLGVYFD